VIDSLQKENQEDIVMIRTAARKAFLLAAVTLSVGAVAVNCSHRDTSDGPGSAIGSVGLAITLPSGATVSTVHYSIKNGTNVEVSSGNINTSDPGATVSLVVGGVAAGSGYTIVLTATASDGSGCMGTSAPFTVVANQSVSVTVLLLCRSTTTTGTINGTGIIDNCPIITSYVVSPLAVSAGGAIDVAAAATDSDPSDTVTYAWTATAGTFDAAGTASTKYHCPAASSQQTLTITASDNIDAASNAPKCSTPTNIIVNCGLCGNGTTDTAAGETCDPPNGTTCDTSCHTIAVVCGNSIVQPGEQCDPPGPIAGTNNVCTATCQIVAAGTGGTVGTGGVAATGGVTGTGGVTATGGVTGAGGTAAGGSTGAGGMSGGGDPSGATAECVSCEDNGTNSTTGTRCAANQRCDSLTDATQKAQCYAALKCMRDNHCAVGGDNSLCYCSRAAQESGACGNGMPDGPCSTAFEMADPNVIASSPASTRANQVLSDLSDPTNPVGLSGRQVGLCDQVKCVTPCAGQF
jgi:hypothetical protein